MSDEPRHRPIVRKIVIEGEGADDFDGIEARIFETLTGKGVPSEHAADIAAGMAREIMEKKETEEKRSEMFAALQALGEALQEALNGHRRTLRRAGWAVAMFWGIIILGFLIDLSRGLEVYLHG